jgi:hypothetical protein
MTTAKEFVEFWFKNSVHPDERYGMRRGQEAVQALVDNLLRAGEAEGFTKKQIESEVGSDVAGYIRASIDRQNMAEDERLRKERK